MLNSKPFNVVLALCFVSIGFACSGEARADEFAAPFAAEFSPMGGDRQFQLAYVTRAETDFLNEDGTEEIVRGEAESLQRLRPGRIIGDFEERILYTDPVTDFDPPGYPAGSFIVKIVDTVSTRAGDVYFEAVVAGVPGADGDYLSTALSGEITGGTGAFANAQGDVTLAGKISLCQLGEPGCAESDFAIPPEGLRYDCHFILRGTL